MADKKKGTYECVADSLAEESLKEAADTFFGQRRSIEEGLKNFEAQVEQLARIQAEVDGKLCTLHFLLRQGREETVNGFYRQVGVDPGRLPVPGSEVAADLSQLRIPFGLRTKSQYTKLMCTAYQDLAAAASRYMDGQYYDDPQDARCKRITVHYWQVEEMCRTLQENIHKANQYNLPTQVLQFAKQLDVVRSDREAKISVPLHYTLDQEMAYQAPDFNQTGLHAYPDFPPLERVKGAIKEYASKVYKTAPDEVRAILSKI